MRSRLQTKGVLVTLAFPQQEKPMQRGLAKVSTSVLLANAA